MARVKTGRERRGVQNENVPALSRTVLAETQEGAAEEINISMNVTGVAEKSVSMGQRQHVATLHTVTEIFNLFGLRARIDYIPL